MNNRQKVKISHRQKVAFRLIIGGAALFFSGIITTFIYFSNVEETKAIVYPSNVIEQEQTFTTEMSVDKPFISDVIAGPNTVCFKIIKKETHEPIHD